MINITKSQQQTQKMGEALGKNLKGGDIVALYGELGAGKTVFVKGVAKALGIKKRILSPTFVFMRCYPLTKGKQLVHIDLYRGQNMEDFEALGLEEIFTKDSIVVLEWAERLKDYLPQKRIDVVIEKKDQKTRKITITTPVISNTSPVIARSGATKQSLKKAASILKSGGVVIFPTDTVYGIGCRYDNSGATRRIYKIKKRPQGQPFPYLVSNIKQVKKLALVTPLSRKLMGKYWPGGLTIILSSVIPAFSSVIASRAKQSQKIGFRMPNHKDLLSIIDSVGVPIIGTSANFHGQPSQSSSKNLDPKLRQLADFVIEGESKMGIESTVIDTTVDPPTILRQGAVKIKI